MSELTILEYDEAMRKLRARPPLFAYRPEPIEPRQKTAQECPICGWPKGERGFLVANVPVGHPLFGVLIRCPACWSGYLPLYLRKLSGLSDQMLTWTLEAMVRDAGRREAYHAARRFVARPQGWLTVWGEYGVGKTYVLAAIVNELRQQNIAAMYVVVPELLDSWRQAYEPDAPTRFDELFARVRDVPVLALDELGQVRTTSWASEKLFQLLDYRYRYQNLGTVLALHFSPNEAPGDWPGEMQAVLSRIREGVVVRMSGGDMRPVLSKGEGGK